MPIIDFTYNAYEQLLDDIHKSGHNFADYHNHENIKNPCILRHDIDHDIKKAFDLAKIEKQKSIRSTYFVLVNNNFYNILSNKNNIMLKTMIEMGHEIGLHFDERIIPPNTSLDQTLRLANFMQCIQKEIKLLENIIECAVRTVSMHMPSQLSLEANIDIPNVINAYSHVFTKEFKYLSDSSHYWREDIETIVSSKKYNKLHILTHPIWYTKNKESLKDKLFSFIKEGSRERYNEMNDNFPDLNKFVRWEDII